MSGLRFLAVLLGSVAVTEAVIFGLEYAVWGLSHVPSYMTPIGFLIGMACGISGTGLTVDWWLR